MINSKNRINALSQFKKIIDSFAEYLEPIKKEFTLYEKMHGQNNGSVNFIKRKRKNIFPKLDRFFDDIWDNYNMLDVDQREKAKEYYEKKMYKYLGEGIETNTYIRKKPLGYDGDFVMMNMIYDYHGDERFFGGTIYSKFINNYTVNIDVSVSNIKRKDFLKMHILNVLSNNKNPQILSVGSGPAREIIELIKEDKIKETVNFNCLDFENKAIEFVKGELDKLNYDKNLIKINFIEKNLIDIIKGNRFLKEVPQMDLVYISGVFDYFKDKICMRITDNLFALLKPDAKLIIANMSKEKQRHRAYYELFGDWKMIHRKKEELREWIKNIEEKCEFLLKSVKGCKSYHFIEIDKK